MTLDFGKYNKIDILENFVKFVINLLVAICEFVSIVVFSICYEFEFNQIFRLKVIKIQMD